MAWARSAAAEHSSVAAFARLSLQLLALGAPAELVTACHIAAIEEIEHARLSYGIASRFAGERLGPGPLTLPSGPTSIALIDLVRETFVDGCVGESAAALEAEDAAALAEDEEIADVLRVIARDEASHALLAFRILAWALSVGGESERDAIAKLVEQAETPDLDVLSARAVREVVVPCARALLA